MKVSIIVPVYNVQNYLNRCIDSILNQDYKSIEVIIVNDGSTDRSSEILKSYNDERIVLIEKENGGVSEARNVGLEKAAGEYVCFVDADDYIENNYISCLVEQLEKSKCDIVCCGYNRINENDEIVGGFPCSEDKLRFNNNEIISKELFFSGMLLHNSIGSILWNKIYKRSLLNGIKFNKEITIGEDLLFLSEYAAKCEKVYFIENKLYNYRVNENGAMKKIRSAAAFVPKWLSEWTAVCEFENNISISDPTFCEALEYKKIVVANKLLTKAKQCSYDSGLFDDMIIYLKKNRIKAVNNPFLNWKIKIKIFLY